MGRARVPDPDPERGTGWSRPTVSTQRGTGGSRVTDPEHGTRRTRVPDPEHDTRRPRQPDPGTGRRQFGVRAEPGLGRTRLHCPAGASPRPGDGAVGDQPWRPSRPGAGAPRIGEPRAETPDRGRSQGGTAARGGRDVEPGVGHRHGGGRSGHPGGGAAVGGLWPAAGRPGRPPGGRGVAGRPVPEVSRRPRADGGDRRTDAGRGDRGVAGARQSARRPRPTGGGHDRPGRVDGRRPAHARAPGSPVRWADPDDAGVGPRHAERAVPVRRVR